MATKLQILATFWQNFGLSNVQKNLDEVASEITARQDESDTSRKVLIELLRDFKKNNKEEVKLSVAPVVKSFQNEVDSLVKRSKAAEKAFLDIYRNLADMPDPLPILEQSIGMHTKGFLMFTCKSICLYIPRYLAASFCRRNI